MCFGRLAIFTVRPSADRIRIIRTFVVLPRDFTPGVARKEIREAPKVVPGFLAALNMFDASVQKGILRVLGCLALHDDAFKRRMLLPAMITRVAACLTSADIELANWAVVLIHDLAMLGEDACRVILQASAVVGAFSQLVRRGSPAFCRLAAETLGFICSHASLHQAAVEARVLRVILQLAESTDSEQQFWATAMLLSLAATREVRGALIHTGVPKAMSVLAVMSAGEESGGLAAAGASSRATPSQISAMAARVLVSLALFDPQVQRQNVRKVRFHSGGRWKHLREEGGTGLDDVVWGETLGLA